MDSIVVGLQVVVEARVVMAAGTLEVDAEEEATNVTGEKVRLCVTHKSKLGSGARLDVGAITAEQLACELVPRLVGSKRIDEVVAPTVGFHVVGFDGGDAALGEHHVKNARHVQCVLVTGEELVN